MKIIYRAENIIDANLVKGTLALEGIVALISGEYLTGAIGELPAWNLLAVMVSDIDVERAAPIVQAIHADLRDARAAGGDFADDALPA
jgi:hypothetical protein